MGRSRTFRLKSVPALFKLDERSPPVGAGLLANAVALVCRWRLDKCFRQQAGSYRSLHSASKTNAAVGPALARGNQHSSGTGFSREAVAVAVDLLRDSPDTAKRDLGAG